MRRASARASTLNGQKLPSPARPRWIVITKATDGGSGKASNAIGSICSTLAALAEAQRAVDTGFLLCYDLCAFAHCMGIDHA